MKEIFPFAVVVIVFTALILYTLWIKRTGNAEPVWRLLLRIFAIGSLLAMYLSSNGLSETGRLLALVLCTATIVFTAIQIVKKSGIFKR